MNIIKKIFVSFLSLLTFIILFIPFYIYRAFIVLLAKFTLPAGSEIIHPQSAMFSPNFCFLSPIGAIVASVIFQDPIDKSKVFQTVANQVVKHSKLRSVPIFYWLYTFWTPVKSKGFSLENHIADLEMSEEGKIIERVEKSEKSLDFPYTEFLKFKKSLLATPFKKGQSPWVIYLVRNVAHPNHGCVDILIFKWHHGLADGLSIIKILGDSLEVPMGSKAIPWKPKGIPFFVNLAASFSALLGILDNVFRGPKGFSPSIVSPPGKNLRKGEQFFLAESKRIEIGCIKGIKNRNEVAFSTVGLTALARALRTFAEQKSKFEINEEDKYQKVPKSVPTSLILHYPGHPDGQLVNHWTCAITPLLLNGSLEEINELGKNFMMQGLINFKRINLFGRLPFFFHGLIISPHCIAYSELPGPSERLKIWGSECLDMSFNINIPPGLFAICCSSLSYDGKWKISFNVDAAVCESQEEAELIGDLVGRYIEEMDV